MTDAAERVLDVKISRFEGRVVRLITSPRGPCGPEGPGGRARASADVPLKEGLVKLTPLPILEFITLGERPETDGVSIKSVRRLIFVL